MLRPRPGLVRVLKTLLTVLGGLLALLAVLGAGVAGYYRAGFGAWAQGPRLERMQGSPQWDDGVFENPQPLWTDTSIHRSVDAMLNGSDFGSPQDPTRDIPVVRSDGSLFAQPPASGLRVTWFGHSSLLIEIDGKRLLTDPVWGPTPSPVPWLGPGRWYAPPMALEQLPKLDAVLISHDHYDHLDYPTFQVIKDWETTFYVPLGVGAHLEYWGVPRERIVELDWWERGSLEGLELVCTPARHASGRGIRDQNATLWAGWALLGAEHRVFFGGDTGLFDGMKKIGTELGPFDLTMLEVGAYHRNWPDWHLGPEQAVLAHQWLRGKFFVPIHWGLFDLALHGWTEPAERVLVAAEQAGVAMGIPRPGASLEPEAPPPLQRWWPQVPWQTSAQAPIVASAANGRPPRTE